MKFKVIFSFLIIVTLLAGCRKDEFTSTSTDPVIPNPSYTYQSSVSGIVIDENAEPITDAIVKMSGETATTDKHGYFKLLNVNIDKDGSFMTIDKSGYFAGYKFVNAIGNQRAHIKVQMIEKKVVASFNAADGATATLNGGATVNISSAGIQKNDGSPYSGNVNMYAHWYDPSDQKIINSMPGDLRALDYDNSLVQLATYGMIAVELVADNGDKLQLLEGTTAQISMPVPSSQQTNAPSEIALWHFDEANGYWMEEGIASLENNAYVGQVSHFSFWNCDAPFPVISITGQLVNDNETPLTGYSLCITIVSSNIVRYGYTDMLGHFSGKVPANQEMILSVKDNCLNTVFELPIGPYSQDSDLGEILVDLGNNDIYVTAQLVDCNNMPLTTGYAIISTEVGYYENLILEPNDNGEVSAIINTCNDFTINFYAYDPVNLIESDVIEALSSSNGTLDLGVVEVCQSIEEYITFRLSGGEVNLISDPSLKITDGVNYIIDGFQSTNSNGTIRFNSLINNVVVNTPSTAQKVEGSGYTGGVLDYFFCNVGNTFSDCSDLSFVVNNTGIPGDYIEGSFTGSIAAELGQLVTIDGEFRIILDEVINTGSISGMAWSDDNENGIRDAGEVPLEGVNMSINADDNILAQLETTIITTGADGIYSFDGLIPNQDYSISINNQDLFLTDKNVGTDTSIDSDFNIQNKVTDVFNITDGQDVIDIDAGFVSTPILECGVTSDCQMIIVTVSGGIAPYTYTAETNFGIITFNDSILYLETDGLYIITVTDLSGQICVTEHMVDPFEITEINGIVWEDLAGGTDHIYDANVDTLMTNVELRIVDQSGNIIAVSTTNTNGLFNFVIDRFDLEGIAGVYYLEVITPPNYQILDANVGNDDTIDNDIDPTTGRVEIFLDPCMGNSYTLDVGLKAL